MIVSEHFYIPINDTVVIAIGLNFHQHDGHSTIERQTASKIKEHRLDKSQTLPNIVTGYSGESSMAYVYIYIENVSFSALSVQ